MSENDIDEEHLPSRPISANALLKLPPGVLNEGFDVDSGTPGAISDGESGWSILQRVVNEVFNPSKLETQKTYKGILMRIDNPYEEGAPHTSTDVALMASTPMKKSTKYKLTTYKVRIPELHLPLPIPNNVYEPTAQDQLIIDQYPTVQATNRSLANKPVSVGDIVWVQVPNSRAPSSGLLYMGPLDSEGLGRGKADGSSPVSPGACLEKCIQTYPNRGSIGDSISKEKLVVKPNRGIPPVIFGQGLTGENRIITGEGYKSWVVNLFVNLHKEGKYKGIIWTGVCKNNGPNDILAMLSDDGSIVSEDIACENGGPCAGRSTVIYMPIGTDPTQPLEIIYWFHDSLGFRNDLKEWRQLWTRSLNEMTKKKARTLEGGRRNFVFVVPEMPWSLEGSDIQTGVPRQQTKTITGNAGSIEASGYRERQWTMWGFRGALKESFEHNGNIMGQCMVDRLTGFEHVSSQTYWGGVDTNEGPSYPQGVAQQMHGSADWPCAQQILTPYSFPIIPTEYPRNNGSVKIGQLPRTWGGYEDASHPSDPGDGVKIPKEELSGHYADEDMELLHLEVIEILKAHFGAILAASQITLIAHGRGGTAISNLARLVAADQDGNLFLDSKTVRRFKDPNNPDWPVLESVNKIYASKLSRLAPSKIVFLDSDHSSVHYNFYHDNDIYQVVNGCNQANPPQIEIHLTVKSKEAATLPQKAAASFIGAVQSSFESDPTSAPTTFKDGVGKLKTYYKIWGHIQHGPETFQLDDDAWSPTQIGGTPSGIAVSVDGEQWDNAIVYPNDPTRAFLPSRSIIYRGYGPHNLGNVPAQALGIPTWSGVLPFNLSNNRALLQAHNTGNNIIRINNNGSMAFPPPFRNIKFKGWPEGNIKGAIGWLSAKEKSSTIVPPIVHQIVQTEKDKKSTIVATDTISDDIKKIFDDFNGKVVLYSSELAGPSKTVAILQTHPVVAWEEYELIYYFHGDIGLNGIAKTFKSALINQFNAMVKTSDSWRGRNVMIVLVDIDPHPLSYSSKLWNNPEKPDVTFNKFHEEVLGKIKNNFAWCIGAGTDTGSQCLGVPYTPAQDPKFFTIKAHGGGSRMLKHAIKNLDPKYIGGAGGLRRIDLLDGNWGAEYGVINTIYTNPVWTSKVSPGVNFEIQIVASPQTFGPKKIPASVRAAKYLPDGDSARDGIWVELTKISYGTLPYKYFSSPSKLGNGPEISSQAMLLAQMAGKISWANNFFKNSFTMNKKTLPPGLEDYTLLTFGKDGKAYAPPGSPYYGMHLPEYDISSIATFYKGKLENHTPSTEQIALIRKCDTDCIQVGSTTVQPPLQSFLINQDCKTNPLGLIEYKTSQFSSIKISPLTANFRWGTEKLGNYLRHLDSGMWLRTTYVDSAGVTHQRPTTWVIKDISPQATNGVDRVRGHQTHREGIEADIVLPQLNIEGLTPEPVGTPGMKRLTSKELDVDKFLALLILSSLGGAQVIFLDKKFFDNIRARANFIATDGQGQGLTLNMDAVLKTFFRKHLFGKPHFVEQIMSLLQHKKGYEDRLKVRTERKLALHEHSNHPQAAIKHLRNLGCDYAASTV